MAQPGVHLSATRECFAMGRLVLDDVEILTVACAAAASTALCMSADTKDALNSSKA